ncbi:ABC transporter permease [Zhenhengia yiwuensis]|uniref:ABC transporter permease n=1 Tax=Zhenhengia yiwuensis TaxID=2763666 RepID=UPI002A758AF0|nr:ABC transporter permease [Zhenhengia yiwuensis]MDY3367552.1 ABC transporter permease [Zhenhengia yiwuensis]
MKISDLIMMSIRSLWRRKLRTFLTILGVVIGASSIILMLSLGIAMDQNFKDQLQEMQSLTVIEVTPNTWEDPKAPKLNDKAIEGMKKIPGVQRVVPIKSMNAYLEFGKYRTSDQVEIKGLSYEDMKALGYKVDKGEIFDEQADKHIILGKEVCRQFVKRGKNFDWRNPPPPMPFAIGEDILKVDIGQYDYETKEPASSSEGQQIEIPRPSKVTIIGTFSEEDWENSYSAVIPLTLFEKIKEEQERYNKKLNPNQNENKSNKEKNTYQTVRVKVESEDQVSSVQEALKEAGYRTYSPMEYLNEMKKASNSIQVMLGGIGAISLMVAAIGITNTMMMSIYERTKEIGVMKVIGAKLTDIKKMFLVEALLIGAIGGGVGVTFSYMLSYMLNKFGMQVAAEMFSMLGSTGSVSVIPVELALAALGFSTVIGLVSGYFPARRAMSLSALSAIKTE